MSLQCGFLGIKYVLIKNTKSKFSQSIRLQSVGWGKPACGVSWLSVYVVLSLWGLGEDWQLL